MNHNDYVSAFVARNVHLIDDCSEALLSFLKNPGKLCPVMRAAPASAWVGSKDFDAMMPSFINGLPADVRREIFQAKLLGNQDRRRIILSFLRNECGENPSCDVDLVDVKDLSTGRARVPGHVVYKIELLLGKTRTRTLFLKGFGATEYSTLLLNFGGWQNRPRMYRYEEFAQKAANIAGVSHVRSRFFGEPHDRDFQGFTLAQQIEGVHSNTLFGMDKIAVIKEEHLPFADTIIEGLAAWHAFADLLGKADRRFLQLTEGYSRSTNYLIDVDMLSIEGVDHEYLFSPQELVAFERKNRHTEMVMLAALPAEIVPAALELYARAYIDKWTAMMNGGAYDKIYALACKIFGPESLEVAYLVAIGGSGMVAAGESPRFRKNPAERRLRLLWNNTRRRTNEVSLPKIPRRIASAPLARAKFKYRSYKGLTFVIKISGKVVSDDAALWLTLHELIDLKLAGCNVILIHGGGDQIDAALDGRKIAYHKIDGVRFTSDEALPVVRDCLSGLNRMIVELFDDIAASFGKKIRAVGNDRINPAMILATEKWPDSRTGMVETIDASELRRLVNGRRVPILHSACSGYKSDLNVNADDLAMPVAESLRAHRLIFCSNTCMLDRHGEPLTRLSDTEIDELIAEGTIHSGAVVKVLACKAVLLNGSVGEVVVLNGRDGSLVKELANDPTAGTHIYKSTSRSAAA